MESDLLFEEIQGAPRGERNLSFRVLGGLLLLSAAVNLYVTKGEMNEWSAGLILAATGFFIASLFSGIRLVTQIRIDGVYVRFPPFQPRFHHYSWEQISDIYVLSYNAMAEFGGWGLRTGLKNKGYILRGDTGIQLVLRDGSLLLISTGQGEEIRKVLRYVRGG